MEETRNLIMNGSGSSSGGLYNKVKIRGEGTISNDFECKVFKAFGSCDIIGSAKAEVFDVFGESEVNGNIISNEVKVLGTICVNGTTFIKQTKVRGTIEVKRRFTGELVDVKGSISVQDDLEVERVIVSGAIEVQGLLNADYIDIGLRFGTSKVQDIGGEKITIKRKSNFIPFLKQEGLLDAETIEADDIYLEYTKANIVRGNQVKLGPGCEIGLVEYYEGYHSDKESKVKEKRKV
ncbi:cytoplasmic protein [Rossellomorea sp. BNER]|nr:cytoplasmic protein [Rossellomorea sp. BNER]